MQAGQERTALPNGLPRVDVADMRPPSEFDFDEGIRPIVLMLILNGIKTIWSCEGGEGHQCHEPTVCFYEDRPGDEYRALALCFEMDFPVSKLQRVYRVSGPRPHELEQPVWEIVFHEKCLPPAPDA